MHFVNVRSHILLFKLFGAQLNMGRKTGAKTESTPAEKRLKALSGIGLSTSQRQLAKALEPLNTLPIGDAVEVLG